MFSPCFSGSVPIGHSTKAFCCKPGRYKDKQFFILHVFSPTQCLKDESFYFMLELFLGLPYVKDFYSLLNGVFYMLSVRDQQEGDGK
ncbi:hypothetical protein AMECASPLE_018448, partial [Ameca splendens]